MSENVRKYVDLYETLKELEQKMNEKEITQAQCIIQAKEKMAKCSLA